MIRLRLTVLSGLIHRELLSTLCTSSIWEQAVMPLALPQAVLHFKPLPISFKLGSSGQVLHKQWWESTGSLFSWRWDSPGYSIQEATWVEGTGRKCLLRGWQWLSVASSHSPSFQARKSLAQYRKIGNGLEGSTNPRLMDWSDAGSYSREWEHCLGDHGWKVVSCSPWKPPKCQRTWGPSE